ncbi:MAG TPA: biopolymer transporter ExbD [Puia sp.]|jgi:biopolymer transport protein ExbD|nr:biopolymer transporter ExbD [Puia sp.]
MAEIISSGNKSGKLSTRVDLTPMVDLGFLLITFFIFTTAMSKPTGLKIFLPKSVPDKLRQPTPASGALTLLLAANNRIYYYEGNDPRQMRTSEANTIRQVILDKKKRTNPEKFMVIIKPGKDSNFEALVNVIDEMTIDNVKRYAMVDLDPAEYNQMQQN